jgi:Arc/MetJ family transcription regulator
VKFLSDSGFRYQSHNEFASTAGWVQNGSMKTSVDLDDDLVLEVNKTVDLVKEKSATVLRMAIRAGLPLVANRFQATRPEGYFADAYPSAQERAGLENSMAKTEQCPER